MNIVDTSDLKPGQIFSEPVYTYDQYLLVPQLLPIRQREIDLLVSCGIKFVSTEGYIIEPEENLSEPFEELSAQLEFDEPPSVEPQPEPPSDQLQPDQPSAQPELDEPPSVQPQPTAKPKKSMSIFSISTVYENSAQYRAYKNLIDKLSAVFTSINSAIDIEMRAVDNITIQLLQDLRNYPDNFVEFILGGEVIGHELAKSSVNTAILSALTANEMKLDEHKIHNIVSGALLHDVGMLRLSKGITEKRGGLSDAELEQIKSHPLHTSKIVTGELFGPKEVNLIALQHHERWDGNGYPDQLSGEAIDIGARIVSIADAFEAMVSKKSYRNSIIGYQAIKNLMADNARRFDPAVIIAFTKIIGIYPIGSIVRFNDSSIGRVISLNAGTPVRPVVQILMDKNGEVLDMETPTIVNLLNVKTLFIKGAIDPSEFDGIDE
ncbi:MAG: HD domain-containing protein [Spirochaetes bacterium]|nr:HD domain-containing protein [Brevinematales bacterium]MCL1958926.1 HD domain-containing protein [Spirochaetota bacterium]